VRKTRGKGLANSKYATLIALDEKQETAEYIVLSEGGADSYWVTIQNFLSDSEKFMGSCTCPYGKGCKHQAAVLIILLKKYSELDPKIFNGDGTYTISISVNKIANDANTIYNKFYEARSKFSFSSFTPEKDISRSDIITFDKHLNLGFNFINNNYFHKKLYTGEQIKISVSKTNHFDFQFNFPDYEKNLFYKSVLYQIHQRLGGIKPFYEAIKPIELALAEIKADFDFDNKAEQNKYIQVLNTPQGPQIEFKQQPFITNTLMNQMKDWQQNYLENVLAEIDKSEIKSSTKIEESPTLAFLIKETKYNWTNNFSIVPIQGVADKTGLLAKKIFLIENLVENKHGLEITPEILGLVRRANKLSNNILKSIKLNETINENIFLCFEQAQKVYKDYLKFTESLDGLKLYHSGNFFSSRLVKKELSVIEVAAEKISVRAELIEENNYLSLIIKYFKGDEEFDIDSGENIKALLFQHSSGDKQYYIIENAAVLPALKLTDKKNRLSFFASQKVEIMRSLIVPLSRFITVDIKLKSNTTESIAKGKSVYLSELGEFMLIKPAAVYEGAEMEVLDKSIKGKFDNDTWIEILRDETFENEILQEFEPLHPDFEKQRDRGFYFLSFKAIVKDNWFIHFFKTLQEKGYTVFGQEKLTKLKYNTSYPVMKMKGGSGIDWFDLSIDVSFGKIKVSLKDLQKAFVRKDKYIALSDGSIGILPDEWMEKYRNLFSIAKVKDEVLNVSKFHFNLLEGLEDNFDSEKFKREIKEKREKLLQFSDIKAVPLPKNFSAQLRDYQQHGYNWLHFLDEFKWGGCLADDMGLGKTIQMLAFLLAQSQKHKNATNLIVVPTTLIFNWEQEIEKFCPQMKYTIFHSTARPEEIDHFKEYDLVITTYGVVIRDIDKLADFKFHYVVLDESQAIKNPLSMRFKAVSKLKANGRIAMTGTPVENNTFDLFAQMSFVNPGLLGSSEFFKETFSNAIDKRGDASQADALKKLISPFIIHRTKTQVLKDLPAKTESILMCEMESQQRKVYEAFKEDVRKKLMQRIEEEGMAKAGIYIIDGLLKLRQLCNSPALIKTEEDYGDESIKIKELMRNILEKTGNHKILVFSQFVKMLRLIEPHLQENNIGYCYLDGQTTNRQDVVKDFIENDEKRVFLISLKAGGVGLNLTIADYVFLVDPWWNPAVEAQAIDRTHRIGQDKKVFAYKMICKDTIEEKILQLQQKKKKLSEDLISTEQGFLKNITKDDLAYLLK